MNHAEALNILKPVGNSMEAVKDAYRLKCKEYHPDLNPNGLEMMKLINCAYEWLVKNLGNWDCEKHRTNETPIDEIFTDILNKINHIIGIEIEICGTWLWVTGETKPYKEIFKELHMSWACKKMAWYWKPEGYKKVYKKSIPMERIRAIYGSLAVETKPFRALEV